MTISMANIPGASLDDQELTGSPEANPFTDSYHMDGSQYLLTEANLSVVTAANHNGVPGRL